MSYTIQGFNNPSQNQYQKYNNLGSYNTANNDQNNWFSSDNSFCSGNQQNTVNSNQPQQGTQDPFSIVYAPGGDLDKGMEWSANSLKQFDQQYGDGDGITKTSEVMKGYEKSGLDRNQAEKIATTLDINGDGNIDAAENLSFALFQDATNQNGADGKVTPEESYAANELILNNPKDSKSKMTDIYNNRNSQTGQNIYGGDSLKERQSSGKY